MESSGEAAAAANGDQDLPQEPADRVQALIERVVQTMGLEAQVEVSEDDEEIRVHVRGDDVGLLIGKHGSTIDALQHLAIRAAYMDRSGDRKAIVVDAAGY